MFLERKNMEPNLFVHSQNAEVVPEFSLLLIIFLVLVGLIVTVIKVLVFCKIFSKTGYCWALGLLMLVPIANIIMVFVLAFWRLFLAFEKGSTAAGKTGNIKRIFRLIAINPRKINGVIMKIGLRTVVLLLAAIYVNLFIYTGGLVQ